MNPTQVAMDARVSSDQQAEAHTVGSQVAALRERVAADGLVLPEAMPCIDEGDSNRALGQSPEDDLLLHVQGMIAEYERAKILERHRRGKRHAAQAGAGHVRSGAPSGYRYVPTYAAGGQARDEMVPEEARVVRQVFDGIGRDRLTIGEVCQRLPQASEMTRTGKTVWDRRVVWGM